MKDRIASERDGNFSLYDVYGVIEEEKLKKYARESKRTLMDSGGFSHQNVVDMTNFKMAKSKWVKGQPTLLLPNSTKTRG